MSGKPIFDLAAPQDRVHLVHRAGLISQVSCTIGGYSNLFDQRLAASKEEAVDKDVTGSCTQSNHLLTSFSLLVTQGSASIDKLVQIRLDISRKPSNQSVKQG